MCVCVSECDNVFLYFDLERNVVLTLLFFQLPHFVLVSAFLLELLAICGVWNRYHICEREHVEE